MRRLERLPSPPATSGRSSRHQLIDIVDPNATTMQRQVAERGFAGFQRATCRALLAQWTLMGRHFTFFDVGANGALYSVLCKSLFPDSEVVAFEPCPETAEGARAVIEANNVGVTLEETALSDHSGSATLFLSSTSDASNSLVQNFRESRGSEQVEAETLDRYVAKSGRTPNVIKIDVEFHELAVLTGARETITRARPTIVAELIRHQGMDQGPDIQAFFEPYGYHAYRLTDPPDWDPRSEVTGRRSERDRGRDWLFTPSPLPADFPDVIDAWDRELTRCKPLLRHRVRRSVGQAVRRTQRRTASWARTLGSQPERA